MQSLSEALPPMPTISPRPTLRPHMPPLGSTRSDGRSTIPLSPPPTANVPVVSRQVSPHPPAENTAGLTKASDSPIATAPKPSASDKQQLAIVMAQVCALQRQYGKTAAELETLVEGFCWALEGYSMPEILSAVRQYVKAKPDIPTPSEILAIVDPPLPPMSEAVYRTIRQKMRDDRFVSDRELAYARKFENLHTKIEA